MTDPSHSVATHPAAPHHLPFFITPPGETDVLLVGMTIFLLLVVVVIGNLYFQLHSLPERVAHRGHHVQMQLVAVLCLLALFTHNHAFWIAALLLAMVHLPDFTTPINSIAQSLEQMVRGSSATADMTGASVSATGDGASAALAHEAPSPLSPATMQDVPVAAPVSSRDHAASLAPPSTAAHSPDVKRVPDPPEQKRA
jgi:hypothetical protein